MINKVNKLALLCLLIYLSTVSFSVAWPGSFIPWKLGKCLVPPVKQNFETEKFFSGHWYTQLSFGNFLFQADGICPTTEYNITDAGEILELDYHFEQWLMKYITVSGNSYTELIKNGEGYLPMKYSVLGGLIEYETPFFIVGTDYESWALIYSCKQRLFLKAEMSWIMTRSRTEGKVTDPILDALNDAGLNLYDYVKAVNVGCGPDEPHL